MAEGTDGAAFETWDVLRAREWDLFAGDHTVETLQELYAALGVGKEPPDVQHTVLRTFMESPPWEAAPEQLKKEAEEVLK